MKTSTKIFLLIILLGLLSGLINAQTVGSGAPQYSVADSVAKPQPKQSGEFYKAADGVTYPVYVGTKGGKFILRTSKKTGKNYRQYITQK